MNKIILPVLSSLLLLASSSCLADVQIAFAGIDGEVPNKALMNAIPLSSVAMGASNSSTVSGGMLTASKATASEISFTKPRGAASAGLQRAVFSGQRIPKAQLRFTRPGTTSAFLLVTLEEVLVTGWQASADESGSAMESFTISFARIKTEDVNPDGTKTIAPAGWDFTKNVSF